MHETIIWNVGNGTVHAKTLVMTWLTMLIVLVFVFLGKESDQR